MIRPGNLPQLRVRGVRMNQPRVPHRNVAVDLAVNQEYRDFCGCDGIFRGNILHAEVILHARAEEGDFD